MRKTIFTFLIIMIGVLLCPSQGFGQTYVIDKSFYKVYTGPDSYETMSNSFAGFSEWTFSGENFAIKNNYVQVGSSSGAKGYITTPELGVSGNLRFLLATKSKNNTAATVKVEISKGETIEQSTFSITAGDENAIFSILITDVTPLSTITISSEKGNFYIKRMIAFIMPDALFYESFSLMTGDGEDFSLGEIATSSLCDNSGSQISSFPSQTNRAIYLNNKETTCYKMPTITSVTSEKRYLLSFKLAGDNGSSWPAIKILCDEEAIITSLNSFDISTANNTQEKTFNDKVYNTWRNNFVVITGMTNTTRISFYGESIFLDEIMLTEIPSSLDQTKDNSLFIDAYNGEERDVTLSRTLTPNIWCPLCLPFSITPSKMATDMGVTCEVRTLDSVTDGVFSFNKVDAGTAITAGTPFLIKVPSLVTNPTFRNVTVSNTPAVVAKGLTENYKFIGTYSPVELNTDGTHLFLGTDGKLYKPSTDAGANLLGGLRAYFEVPAAAQGARIMINDEVSTVDNVRTATGQQLFDLYGRQVGNRSPKRGLYIVRPAEGRLQGKNGQKLIVK